MTKQKLDRTIETYLTKLRHEAAVLPADRRKELLDEIRAHAASAVAEGESPETVVTELGDPETVVAEAQSNSPAEAQFTGTDVGVILLMALTVIFTVITWAAAAWKIRRSTSWTTKQKVIGVVVWPWAAYAVNSLLLPGPDPSIATGPVTWFFYATAPFGTLAWAGAVYLYRVHPARVARQRKKQAEGSRLHRSLGDSFRLRR